MHEVGQKTVFGFVVYGAEEQNRFDRWEDYVFLNRRKDGSYSLKAYKWAESFTRANKMVWIAIDSEIGFRGAQCFDQAIPRMGDALGCEIDREGVLGVLKKVDTLMHNELQQIWE